MIKTYQVTPKHFTTQITDNVGLLDLEIPTDSLGIFYKVTTRRRDKSSGYGSDKTIYKIFHLFMSKNNVSFVDVFIEKYYKEMYAPKVEDIFDRAYEDLQVYDTSRQNQAAMNALDNASEFRVTKAGNIDKRFKVFRLLMPKALAFGLDPLDPESVEITKDILSTDVGAKSKEVIKTELFSSLELLVKDMKKGLIQKMSTGQVIPNFLSERTRKARKAANLNPNFRLYATGQLVNGITFYFQARGVEL